MYSKCCGSMRDARTLIDAAVPAHIATSKPTETGELKIAPELKQQQSVVLTPIWISAGPPPHDPNMVAPLYYLRGRSCSSCIGALPNLVNLNSMAYERR